MKTGQWAVCALVSPTRSLDFNGFSTSSKLRSYLPLVAWVQRDVPTLPSVCLIFIASVELTALRTYQSQS